MWAIPLEATQSGHGFNDPLGTAVDAQFGVALV